MAKTNEQLFTYLKGNPVVVPAGMAFLLGVPGAYDGTVNKLLAQQLAAAAPYLGGAPVAYKVDILNSRLGLSLGAIDPLTLPPSWPMYRVMAQQNAAAGAQINNFTPAGTNYRNVDGDQTSGVRFLYLLLQPVAAAGETRWELGITLASSHGG